MQQYCHKKLPNPHGLHNTGVICYFNSTIQALINVPVFVDAVSSNTGKICTAFKRVIDGCNKNVVFNEVIQICRKNRRYVSFMRGQEDAEECLTILIDLLSEEVPNIEKLFKIKTHFIHRCKCKISTSSLDYANYILHDFSEDVEYTPDEFSKELLLQKTTTDRLCSECGQYMQEYTRFKNVGNIIVVVLKKYDKKKLIKFPQKLRIPTHNSHSMIYTLCSVINHSGGRHGGHYTAFGIRPDDITEYNDMGVSNVTNYISPRNYVLYYQYDGVV